MTESIVDELGHEVTAILGPVSLCIALTVFLVRLLNPGGASDARAVGLASSFYTESADDSTWEKLEGSLLNAAVFVVVIGLLTFVLVYAFKKGYTGWITAYMACAVFPVYFVIGGFIVVGLLQRLEIAWDWPSVLIGAANVAVVGSMTLFVMPAPLLLKQTNLVALAVGTAFVFTFVPDWSTWILLLAMAIYDIVAVLSPYGPLKMLVELAEETDQPIPALVYSARPVGGRGQPAPRPTPDGAPVVESAPPPGDQATLAAVRRDPDGPDPSGASHGRLQGAGAGAGASSTGRPAGGDPPEFASLGGARRPPRDPPSDERGADDEESALLGAERRAFVPGHRGSADAYPSTSRPFAEDDRELYLPDAVRLGLGDFIFYSVMVGRASMRSALGAMACYLAVISGLVCTLAWLAVSHHALPALPFSIVLGMCAFFAAEWVLAPVVLPLALHGVEF